MLVYDSTLSSVKPSKNAAALIRWSLATIVFAPRGGHAADGGERGRRELFRWAAATGFAGVEVSPRWCDVLAMSSAERRTLQAEIADAGLVVSGVNLDRCLLAGAPEEAAHWDRLQRGLDAAADLGAGVVDFALSGSFETLPDRPVWHGADFTSSQWSCTVERIRDLAARAAERNVALSVELHDDGLLDTATACLHFREAVDARNLGVNPDIGNLYRGPQAPEPWEPTVMLLAPWTNCWHLKNYRGGEPAPLDDGDIDYERVMEILLSAGFDGWASVESRAGEMRASQAQSLAFLRATLAKLQKGER